MLLFTFRLNSYRIFKYFVILIVVSSVKVTAGQKPKKCAEFNEYCQNHWDCCSNSCMSYLYRCSRGYNVYPYPFLGVSYKPTVTLEQILDQNFGSSFSVAGSQPKPSFASRFGGPTEEDETTQFKIVLQDNSLTTNLETTTIKTPIVSKESTVVLENRLGDEVKDINSKDNEVVSPTTQGNLISSTTKPPCSEIGAKCYKNDECCTKRCHGFLHQCVT